MFDDALPNSQASITRVMVENVSIVWPQVKALFDPLFLLRPTHDAEDIRKMLLNHTAQLWVQWADVIEAAFVTEFATYPKGVWVRIWLGAARKETAIDQKRINEVLVDWCHANGARGYEVIGRHGWTRRFPEARIEGLVLRATFDGE